MSETYGWRAQLLTTTDSFLKGSVRLAVYRSLGSKDEVLTVTGKKLIDPGTPSVDQSEELEWLLLPTDCLVAIRDALDAHFGDKPTTTENKALREALEIERGRVTLLVQAATSWLARMPDADLDGGVMQYLPGADNGARESHSA